LVKPAISRAQKYAAKFDGPTMNTRFTAVKDLATAEQEIQSGALVQMETSVKGIVESGGNVTSPTDIPQFLAYARQIYARSRKYSGTILRAEVINFCHTWYNRGLDGPTLVAVAGLFGVTLSSAS
jgi:hypothetical protein